MSRSRSLISSIKWISSVSKRFSRIDRSGRSAVTSKLATLGICFGVMTLISVMSVMNGFQMSFIDAILELSSYHLRVENVSEAEEEELFNLCAQNKNITGVTPFYEAQTLMYGTKGKEQAAVIRAVPADVYKSDAGFRNQLKLVGGQFNLSQSDSMVIGSTLARNLGLKLGSTVNLYVLSGGSDVSLFSDDRVFTITGIFSSGYAEINSGYCFINIDDAPKYLGASAKKNYGIKLKNSNDDMRLVSYLTKNLKTQNSQIKVQSWREYNKTFFGALRIEKNMLLLLVALIFVVVAINIYNGMRRLVFERRSEIAVFSALGATNSEIQAIFIFRGFITGVIGAVSGLILGLLISVNTDFVFTAASKVMFYSQYLFTALFNRQNLAYIQENSTYLLYATIPARIFFSEVFMISIFGVLAPLFASWAASKNILKMTVAEVLHNE